jgi:predicted transcriptional regulator
LSSGDGRQDGVGNSPVEQVRAVLQQANNYFAELEAAADACRITILGQEGDAGMLLERLTLYARDRLGLRVRVIPAAVMGTQLRRYDQHRGKFCQRGVASPAAGVPSSCADWR